MGIELGVRNASLKDLAALLQRQHDVMLDAVVPAQAITSQNGVLSIAGLGEVPDTLEAMEAGEKGSGQFVPTKGMDGDIAERLGIPIKYLRRMRAERADLYDANVNGWLQGDELPDPRNFLVRTFRDPEGGTGIGRALLSDTYKRIDNLDVLLGALQAVRESGVQAIPRSANLTESRLVVDFVCPEVQVVAQELLRNYRNPFEGNEIGRWRPVAAREGMGIPQGDEPIVFAGFEVSNSETGGGACSITPKAVVQVCLNGLKLTVDMFRSVHLGQRQEQGVVRFSDDTERLNLELIKARTRDAVTSFVNLEYLKAVVDRLEQKAAVRLENPAEAVEIVANKLAFTEAETSDLLNLFMAGGQVTAGGMMQAVSALAQCVEDADRAYEIEGQALMALDLVAA